MTEDILEKAKDALDHAISESSGGVYLDPSCNDLLPICRELIAEVERLRSDQDAIMAAWDKDAVEHDARIKELEANNKRLEAAFLKAEKANLMHHMDADYADENAREALERIRNGELREAAINKLLSMKKLEVIEQIKEEIRSGKDE